MYENNSSKLLLMQIVCYTSEKLKRHSHKSRSSTFLGSMEIKGFPYYQIIFNF